MTQNKWERRRRRRKEEQSDQICIPKSLSDAVYIFLFASYSFSLSPFCILRCIFYDLLDGGIYIPLFLRVYGIAGKERMQGFKCISTHPAATCLWDLIYTFFSIQNGIRRIFSTHKKRDLNKKRENDDGQKCLWGEKEKKVV